MVTVRSGTPTEFPAVMNILDGAFLDTDPDRIQARLRTGTVLVAIDDGRLVGALVLDDTEVTAIAVRPRRRDAGIGTALIEAAAERLDTDASLTAEFDDRLRPFYEACGFEVSSLGPDRSRGIRQD